MGRTLRRSAPETTAEASGGAAATARPLRDLTPVALVVAAHPRQALVTALVLAAAAALDGRPPVEVLLVLVTVLLGQAVLGWHNDLVDRERDRAAGAEGKPVADGRLDPGTVWFTLACAVLVLVPLAVTHGVTAGSAYLLALAVGLLGNLVLRGGLLSWLPWAVQLGLYPAFLSYGGWGGVHRGDPPEPAVVALAALVGVGVHVLRALPGLVVDHRTGLHHLPLRLALRTGAPRLLLLASAWTGATSLALLLVARQVGIGR